MCSLNLNCGFIPACQKLKTRWQYHLYNVTISCPEHTYLNQLTFDQTWWGKLRYKYKCCAFKDKQRFTEETFTIKNTKQYEKYFLITFLKLTYQPGPPC